jgi:hypothetical protein
MLGRRPRGEVAGESALAVHLVVARVGSGADRALGEPRRRLSLVWRRGWWRSGRRQLHLARLRMGGSARLGLSPRGAGDGVGARRAPRSGVVGATAVQRAVVGARRHLTVVAPIRWSGGSRPRGGRRIFQLHEQR